MNLWIGKEMEGKHKGVKTLFIASPCIMFEKVEKVLKEFYGIEQLYFGAGCCTDINTSVMMKSVRKFKNLIITAEVDIHKLDDYACTMFKDVNLIITVNHKNFGLIHYNNIDTTQIKLQALNYQREILTTGQLNDFIETDLNKLNGKKYVNDEVIE